MAVQVNLEDYAKPCRAQAIADGIPLYSAYLKTGGTVYPNTATWVRDVVLPV